MQSKFGKIVREIRFDLFGIVYISEAVRFSFMDINRDANADNGLRTHCFQVMLSKPTSCSFCTDILKSVLTD